MAYQLVLSDTATVQLDDYIKRVAQRIDEVQDTLDNMRVIFSQGLRPINTERSSSNVFPAHAISAAKSPTVSAAPVPPAPPKKAAHPLDAVREFYKCSESGEMCCICEARFSQLVAAYEELPTDAVKAIAVQLSLAHAARTTGAGAH